MGFPHCSSCICRARKVEPSSLSGMIGTAVFDLDNRIEQLRASVLQLQRERNNLIPVNRLPAEIMSLIYVIHRENAISSLDDNKIHWTRITHVCHSWRSIALGNTSLWNSVDLRTPTLALELIRRANGAPLHVHLSKLFGSDLQSESSRENLRNALALLAKEDCRIDGLDVTANSHIELRRVLDVVTHSSHTMRIIRLSLDNGDPYAHLPSIKLNCTGLCTDLRHLYLSDCIVNWTSVLFAEGTRELEVRFTRRAPESIGTLQELQEMLGRLPMLERLILRRCTNGETWPNDNPPRIALPSLRSLIIEDGLEGCFSILQGLALPENCNTHIQSVVSSGWGDQTLSLPRFVVRPDLGHRPALVRVNLAPLRGFLEVLIGGGGAPEHHLAFSHLSSVDTFFVAIARYVVPLAYDTLVITPNSRLAPEHWRGIMSGAVAHTLRLSCSSPYCGFWDALASPASHTFLPEMRVLVLEGLNFSLLDPSGRKIEKEFLLALKQRTAHGSLKTLSLEQCSNVTPEVLERWSAIFPGVEWDGDDTTQGVVVINGVYAGLENSGTVGGLRNDVQEYHPGLAF